MQLTITIPSLRVLYNLTTKRAESNASTALFDSRISHTNDPNRKRVELVYFFALFAVALVLCACLQRQRTK